MASVKLPSARALQLLHERKLLPVFPGVLTRLDEVINNPHSNGDDVAAVLAADVLLASRVMRAASGVRYGPKPPSSLVEAVARLGLVEVRAIALAVAFSASFARPANISLTVFWQHAFVAAVATRALTQWLSVHRQLSVCDAVTAFLLGLSHDMGMLLLDLLEPDQYAQVLQAVHNGEDQLLAEQRFVGTTHAVMSAALLHHWHFSDQMSMALAGHHYPVRLQPAVQHWADVVLLGEALAASLGYVNGVYTNISDMMQEVVEQRRAAMQLDDDVWHEIGSMVSHQLEEEGWLELANGI
ncbi:MAG: HDOD domain-containing protein [Gammaproteobacteria bacterium]|nr:HDOD domain-containing protein [Gammaproteobacteria bacterium]